MNTDDPNQTTPSDNNQQQTSEPSNDSGQQTNISDASARALGSKKLTKINISAILAGYDIGYSDYILSLKEGLAATKLNEQTGEKVPDYRTRLEYQRILGKLLGF